MLGQHPALYSVPELNLFLADRLEQLLAWDARPLTSGHYLAGLIRALAELEFGSQSPQALQRARSWLRERSHWTTTAVWHRLSAIVAPRALVDKSPRTALAPASCARALSVAPTARYLHLTRHPDAALQSLWNTIPSTSEGQRNALTDIWLSCQETILAMTGAMSESQCLRVAAESLLRAPFEAWPPVLKWLGLSDTAHIIAQMLHPERSPYAFVIPELAGADGDVEFLRDPHLRPPTVSSVPSAIQQLRDPRRTAVQAMVQRLGYGQPCDDGAR